MLFICFLALYRAGERLRSWSLMFPDLFSPVLCNTAFKSLLYMRQLMNKMLQYVDVHVRFMGLEQLKSSISHSEVDTDGIFSTFAFAWRINTHRAQRSCSIIVASSPHCRNSIIWRVHAGVSERALDPLLSCPVVCVVSWQFLFSKEKQFKGFCCEQAGEELQNDASCPAEQLLLTGTNEGYNNGGPAGIQNRRGGFCA